MDIMALYRVIFIHYSGKFIFNKLYCSVLTRLIMEKSKHQGLNGSCTICAKHTPSLCTGLRKESNYSRVPTCMNTPETGFVNCRKLRS